MVGEKQDPDQVRRYGRGVFLATVAGGLSSLVWGQSAWSRLSGIIAPVAGVVAPFLPSRGWRIYAVSGSMPRFASSSWSLSIGGLVNAPRSFDLEALYALPHVEQVSSFHCVTGWTVKNVHWTGIRITTLLELVQPQSSAHALEFVSMENPYVDYLTLRQALLPDVMLAYGMDGRPLAREHGAPVRLVIPDMYGYKSVKWVKAINLIPRAKMGYWEQRGYDRDAWVGHSNWYGL